MLNEWLVKNNVKSSKDQFIYTAWWNHQAQSKHFKRSNLVKPEHIVVSKKAITKEVTRCLLNNDLTFVNELFNNFNPKPLINLPDYLVFADEKKNGFYNALQHDESVIDYSLMKLPFERLDGFRFDEYTIRLPRTTEEVQRGGYIMCNCMSGGSGRMLEFFNDPIKYQDGYQYLDAHIIKDNKLVGIFALEEILSFFDGKSVRKSIFVNYCNSYNLEMEAKLKNIIELAFNILVPNYNLNKEYDKPVNSGNYHRRKFIELNGPWWDEILESKLNIK